jgi:hypothetical protein
VSIAIVTRVVFPELALLEGHVSILESRIESIARQPVGIKPSGDDTAGSKEKAANDDGDSLNADVLKAAAKVSADAASDSLVETNPAEPSVQDATDTLSATATATAPSATEPATAGAVASDARDEDPKP